MASRLPCAPDSSPVEVADKLSLSTLSLSLSLSLSHQSPGIVSGSEVFRGERAREFTERRQRPKSRGLDVFILL
jgi:hypothetical protein